MTPSFSNKTVLITGAGTGMGRATALHLAKQDAELVLLGRRPEPLATLLKEVESIGARAIALPCDITDPTSLSVVMNQVEATFGKLDGVFANAGILEDFVPLSDTTLSHFDTLIDSNLKGTFSTIKASLPLITEGSIVINASWTAKGVMPGAGAYAATKGALLSLTTTLAVELGPRQIRVNAINPGIILTPMAAEVLDPELSKKLAEHTALKRNGRPEDVSGTVAWLLSDDAAFVTGQSIDVDGGYTIAGVRL